MKKLIYILLLLLPNFVSAQETKETGLTNDLCVI